MCIGSGVYAYSGAHTHAGEVEYHDRRLPVYRCIMPALPQEPVAAPIAQPEPVEPATADPTPTSNALDRIFNGVGVKIVTPELGENETARSYTFREALKERLNTPTE